MSVLTSIITQTVNDCINVSDRKIATRNKQNIILKVNGLLAWEAGSCSRI